MANELVLVPLGDDHIQAVQQDGHVWAAIKGMCESLSLDPNGQIQRLKRTRWAVTCIMHATGADKKAYEMMMIRADKIPMWLVTVERSRIKDKAVQAKLDRFQEEAADVLARHFLRKPTDPTASADQLRDIVTRIVAESLTPFLSQIRAAMPAPMPIYPRATIRERLHWKNWIEASPADRKKIHKLACALIDANMLETPVQAGGPGGGGPLYFFGAQLAYLDEAIDRVRDAKVRSERARGPHLFSGVAS